MENEKKISDINVSKAIMLSLTPLTRMDVVGADSGVVLRKNDLEFLGEGFLVLRIKDAKQELIGLFVWNSNKEKLYGPFTKKPEEVVEQKYLLLRKEEGAEKYLSTDGFLRVDDYFFPGNPKDRIPDLQINFKSPDGKSVINYCVSGLDGNPDDVIFEEDHG